MNVSKWNLHWKILSIAFLHFKLETLYLFQLKSHLQHRTFNHNIKLTHLNVYNESSVVDKPSATSQFWGSPGKNNCSLFNIL